MRLTEGAAPASDPYEPASDYLELALGVAWSASGLDPSGCRWQDAILANRDRPDGPAAIGDNHRREWRGWYRCNLPVADDRFDESRAYDDMTGSELRKRASTVGIQGRSSMDKADLIKALRNH